MAMPYNVVVCSTPGLVPAARKYLSRVAFLAKSAALAVVGAHVGHLHGPTPYSALLSAVIMLAAGACAALLAIFVRAFGRLFLHGALLPQRIPTFG